MNFVDVGYAENACTNSTLDRTEVYRGDWGTGGEATKIRFKLTCSYYKYDLQISSSGETIRNDTLILVSRITSTGDSQGNNLSEYEHIIKNREFDYFVENIPFPIPSSTDYSEISEFCRSLMEEKMGYKLVMDENTNNYIISTVSFLKSISVEIERQILSGGAWVDAGSESISVNPNITKLSLSLHLDLSTENYSAKTIGKSGFSYDLEKNELLQSGTKIIGKTASEYLATEILQGYKNGKETATITCGINEYFDEIGGKRISLTNIVLKDLPDDYQEVEYIENKGSAYIDTGYSAPQGFSFELQWEWTASESATRYIVGSHNKGEPYGRNGVGSNAYNKWEIGVGDRWLGVGSTIVQNKIYKVEGSTKAEGNLKINGEIEWSIYDNTVRSGYPLLVFSSQYHLDVLGNRCAIGKLYYLKIYDGDIVRDFVPCYRKSDGEVGLYDLVGGKFYTSASDGAKFLKGNDKIRTKMSFRMYDEVIPMVLNSNGEDVPMSQNKDGTAKHFIVVGSNIYYDGAVFQELSLQET